MKFTQHRDTNQARIFLLLPLIQHEMKKPFPPPLFGPVRMELFLSLSLGTLTATPSLSLHRQLRQTFKPVFPWCDCSPVLYITLTAQHPTVTQGYTNNNEPAKNSSSPEHARHVHWLPGSCRTSRWLQGGLVLPTCYWGSPPPLGSSLFWCYTPPASRLSQHLPSAGLSAYCFPCSVEQRHRISIISSCTWNIRHICGRTWIQRAKTIKVQALWFTNNSSSSIFFY